MTFSDYSDDPSLHAKSPLVHDTDSSRSQVRTLMRQFPNASIQARFYDVAPYCFLLIADDSAFVEQYVLGKGLPKRNEPLPEHGPTLGKEMPIVEFKSKGSTLFPLDELKKPSRLLNDHFDFVFDHCSHELS
jgi:hypothetical protein